MSGLEAKIVVLGAQGVGKTSLVHRYVKNTFSPGATASTVGASFLTKRVVDDESDTLVRLQIWDTAGQERFRSISRLYYRGANACILCYSITDEASFADMGIWLAELRRNLPSDIILHVVGTKADLVAANPDLRKVPFERCIAYIADHLYPAQSSTPPPTAAPHGEVVGGYRYFSHNTGTGGAGPSALNGNEAVRSPSSKRSSGFWGQDVGWDCCHEISAESGEGVEEVFRVITRKLVAQHRAAQDAASLYSPSGSNSGAVADGESPSSGYFDAINPRGSFRGARDRRSWLGFPSTVVLHDIENAERAEPQTKAKSRCC